MKGNVTNAIWEDPIAQRMQGLVRYTVDMPDLDISDNMRKIKAHARLMIAVMERMWVDVGGPCIQGGDNQDQRKRMSLRLVRQALEWSKVEDWVWPFSFVRICEALDMDIPMLRRLFQRSYDFFMITRGFAIQDSLTNVTQTSITLGQRRRRSAHSQSLLPKVR